MVTLPWPPSVNRYWRPWRGRMVISKEGRAYRNAVAVICAKFEQFSPDTRLRVEIKAYPPDRRRRDLDNILKAILDALEGHVYPDDSQVDDLRVVRHNRTDDGAVEVHCVPI